VYNKIDMLSIVQVDQLARTDDALVISVNKKLNLDGLLQKMWEELKLVRIYTKQKGMFPVFKDPLVLTQQRGTKKPTVENAVGMLHMSLLDEFKCALVWGSSTKHESSAGAPMIAGLKHELADEDVMLIQKLTPAERHRRSHGKKTGTTMAGTNTADAAAEKKKGEKKAPLKT